jgi:hypothetical protein
MEQNQSTQGSSLFSLNLDAQNSYTLRSAASWGKVLGILSLIMGGLCIIGGILVQQVIRNAGNYGGYRSYRNDGFSSSNIANAGMIVYVIIGLIYIASGIFALNAGNKITSGLRNNNMEALNGGFAGVRNFFALWAILMIISLLFVLIAMLGSL